MKCPICESTFDEQYAEKLETDCLFAEIEGIDQHLVRHRCPVCNVIFGPQQMLNLTRDQLKDAYQVVFNSGYQDGNESSSNMEIFDLLALNPTYEGVYLNYGAGTSTATAKARKLNYNLIPYDPFIPNQPSYFYNIYPSLYDGIISHNLLEHLQDPIGELKKMKSMLKPGARMIHSTECYKYVHEQTKFHLFFFEGKSLDIISSKAGLKCEFIGMWAVRFTQI